MEKQKSLFQQQRDEIPVDHLPDYVTVKVLADLIALTPKRVQNMVIEGKLQNDGQNKYNLRSCCRDYVKFLKKGQVTKKSEFESAKLEKLERENKIAAGDLINTQVAAQLFMGLASVVVDALEALGPRMAAELAAETDAGKVQSILYEECREIRDAISRKGKDSGFAAAVLGDNETSPEKNSQ